MKTLKTLLQEITAGIKAWANASFSSGTHVHGNITNNGKLATASKVVISDSNKNITTSNVSDTELGHLSGVTSAIQTQINSKAYDADVVHTTGNETIAGTKTFASTINGTASKAVADEDGNNIKTTYGKLASDQTWTGVNTFSHINRKFWSVEKGVLPTTNNDRYTYFLDKNGATLGYTQISYNMIGNVSYSIWVQNSFSNGQLDPTGTDNKSAMMHLSLTADGSRSFAIYADTIPNNSNWFNLGTSTHQWKSVYAQTYYYNGTAWGLDKENVWTGSNRFAKHVGLSDISTYSDNTMAFTANANTIFFNTRGSSNYPSFGTFLFAGYASGTAPDRYGQLKLVRSTDIKGGTYDGYKPDSSFNLWRVAPHYSLMEFVDAIRVQNDGTNNYIAPITTNATNLGTSTNKWKSFNDINPGALSFPNHAGIIDVTGDVIPPTGETSVNISGGINSFTAPSDGWLVVRHDAATFVQIYRNSYNSPGTTVSRPTEGKIVTSLPVIKDTLYTITVIAQTGTFQIKFYPCLGNV